MTGSRASGWIMGRGALWLFLAGSMLGASPASIVQPAAPDDASRAGDGYLGVLLPQQSVDLAPLVEGRLQRVNVRIGDRLDQNAVVAELDQAPIKQERGESVGRLDEARAEEAEASTRVQMAQETLERRRALVATGVVSAEQVREAERERELAQAFLDRSRARVQQQRAAMERIEARLSQTKLLAPFAGRVAERYADPGMSVGPNVPVVRLISDAGLWARFAVPVHQAGDLMLGGPIRARVTGVGLEVTGTIVQVGSAVDEASGMIFYEATVRPPPGWSGPPLAGQAIRLWPDGGAP